VDEEIKTYITGHKHDLMSGMQDVATLATRYQELESTAHKLRTSIDKMQRETSESYELVRSRTMELERIHETSIVLKQLRQFNHAKAQLDHYTQEATDLSGVKGLVFSFLPPPSLWSPTTGDLRQYSTMAKIIQELETLLRSPALSSLAIVKSQTEIIKRMGSQLRSLSQERLLNALDEQNQATVAECLQVRKLPLLTLTR
jgi:chaperonin cofactor prefoldin